jgi:multiple sugar transport system permease protein
MEEDLPRNPNKSERLARLQELYDEAVDETNEKMLGQVPEEKMKVRRRWAAGIIALIAIAFGILFRYIWKLFTPPASDRAKKKKWSRETYLAYALLAPAVLTIFLFHYYPLLRGAVMAFQDYNVLGGSTFVGVDNFAEVLFDKVFWVSFLRTAEYVAWSLLLIFIAPIVLAVILSEIPMGKVVFRVIYYLPAVVSGLVVMLMWKMFLDPTESGTFNQVLAALGIGPQKWLQDSSLAMISIIMPMSWATLGPGCLIYIAALKTVADDLYEAAAIDGAGVMGRIWHVSFPIMRPLILIQLIFVLIGAFQSADNVLVMTGGGPDYATHVVGLEIFYSAYVYLRFGTAIAIAWILGFLLIGLTMLQMKRIARMDFTTADSD